MAGQDAFGTTLSRGDGAASEAFTAIANVVSIDPLDTTRDVHDVTAHDSADKHREFIGGIVDGGSYSAEINWDPAADITGTLLADFEDPDPVNYQIAFPDGSSVAAALLITGFSGSAPYDDKLSATLTFKVTGKPVFAAS